MKKKRQSSSYSKGKVTLSRSRYGVLNIAAKDFNNVQSALAARGIVISAITSHTRAKRDGTPGEERLRLYYEPAPVKPFSPTSN